jgi:hypothetical protein
MRGLSAVAAMLLTSCSAVLGHGEGGDATVGDGGWISEASTACTMTGPPKRLDGACAWDGSCTIIVTVSGCEDWYLDAACIQGHIAGNFFCQPVPDDAETCPNSVDIHPGGACGQTVGCKGTIPCPVDGGTSTDEIWCNCDGGHWGCEENGCTTETCYGGGACNPDASYACGQNSSGPCGSGPYFKCEPNGHWQYIASTCPLGSGAPCVDAAYTPADGGATCAATCTCNNFKQTCVCHGQ